MRSLAHLNFDNTYARLPSAFYQVVDPTPLPDPYLVAFNPDAALLIDLDPAAIDHPDSVRYLSGALRLPGAEPVAMVYAGHQFGVWVPQLGDGRAILLGQIRNHLGELWDLHLKGAGLTRYSRMGDGRSVLRSAIREYLGSEALHGLGIPTTRALSIVGSKAPVYREVPETAATLMRLAPSHLRFGTFQFFAARGETDQVRLLADHLIAEHFPALDQSPERYRNMLAIIVNRTADLMARWTAVGFAHGVMNTDNMSVLGLTLDYGPFGFLDDYDPNFICNHTDQQGRYAFGQQPGVGLWNLARFTEALIPLITLEEGKAALEPYPDRFEQTYSALMRAKLGLRTVESGDAELLVGFLGLLQSAGADYTHAFRALSQISSDDGDPASVLTGAIGDRPALHAWLARYRARLRAEGSHDAERRSRMLATNPKYILRNYLAQQAIERAQADDFSEIERLHQLLRDPFAEHPEMERYAEVPPPWGKELIISCSS